MLEKTKREKTEFRGWRVWIAGGRFGVSGKEPRWFRLYLLMDRRRRYPRSHATSAASRPPHPHHPIPQRALSYPSSSPSRISGFAASGALVRLPSWWCTSESPFNTWRKWFNPQLLVALFVPIPDRLYVVFSPALSCPLAVSGS